jgi:hypothetical protein
MSVLTRTYTLCPLCTIVEGKGMLYGGYTSEWELTYQYYYAAVGLNWECGHTVAREDGTVWLELTCPTHGFQATLVCSDAAFYKRMRSFALHLHAPWLLPGSPLSAIPDIEDMCAYLRPGSAAHSPSRHAPACLSVVQICCRSSSRVCWVIWCLLVSWDARRVWVCVSCIYLLCLCTY